MKDFDIDNEITKQVAETLFGKEMTDSLNDIVNQHRKVIDSEYMQRLIKMHQSALESMKNSGMVSGMEKIAALQESLKIPQVFRFPEGIELNKQDQQDIRDSKSIVMNPDISDAEKIDAIDKCDNAVTKNPSKQTKLILQDLVPYFEDDIPFKLNEKDYNKKLITNFMQEIADEYEVSLRTIQRIAKQYKDCYIGFLPSKK